MGKEGVKTQEEVTAEEAKGVQEDPGFNLPLDREEGDPAAGAPSPKKKEKPASEEKEEGAEEEVQGEESAGAEEEGQENKQKEETPEEIPEEELSDEEINNRFTTPKEKALYRELKKERANRSETEKERDFLKLKAKFHDKPAEKGKEKQEEQEEEDPVAKALEGKTDEDIISIADVKKILAAQEEKAQQEARKRAERRNEDAKEQQRRMKEADAYEDELRKTHTDVDEALHYANVMVHNHPGLAAELHRISREEGIEAVTKYVYELGKEHRDFGTGKYKKNPAGKEDLGRKSVGKAINNAEKPKTSAGAGAGSKPGAGFSNAELEAMDGEELAKHLATLPENEFGRVPKHIRKKALAASG